MKDEDKLGDRLKDNTNDKSDNNSKIVRMINDTIRSNHKVYLATDWHLYTKYTGEKFSEKHADGKVHRRYNYEEVLQQTSSTLKENDLLIFLGDLVDGEFEEINWPILRGIINQFNGKKILVRGNNDLFPDSFYLKDGLFSCVVNSFVWSNILFTHYPQPHHGYDMNIHGHIHGYREYWVPYDKHIDVAALGGRIKPVELRKVMSSLNAYSKTIKEKTEHFDESFVMEDLYP